MRILHVLPTLDPSAGGPLEGVKMLAPEMVGLGNEVEVATLDAPGEEFLKGAPFVVHALGPSRWGYRYSRHLRPWLSRNASRFDAVIVNGIWQYHSFCVWRSLAGGSVPYFVFTHGMLDPWFGRAYPFKHLKKWMYWPWAEYRVLKDARRVIFTCEEERRLAAKSFWLYRCTEAVTTYGTREPPPDPSGRLAAAFIGKHPELAGKRVILFLSRIHEKKGCDLLVRAFASLSGRYHDLHLVIAGPDQTGLVHELKSLARSLGVSNRITWPGMLQGDDKWGAFHTCEVFCLPSHQENFGIVVAEALGCGKPVLISNKVNIWREIEADSAGFVRDDTLEGTIDGLTSWLSLDPPARESMSSAALVTFKNRFCIKRVARHFAAILRSGIRDGAEEDVAKNEFVGR